MKYDIIHGEWDSFINDDNEYDLIYLDPPFFTQRKHKMDKNSIKNLLTNTFVNEATVPGLDVTNKAKGESGKQNKKAIKSAFFRARNKWQKIFIEWEKQNKSKTIKQQINKK